VGRDVISGCWSFQLVEAYDSGYWRVFRDAEEHARAELGVPVRHVFEAEMKEREQRAPHAGGNDATSTDQRRKDVPGTPQTG
jgi:hypothetical protein